MQTNVCLQRKNSISYVCALSGGIKKNVPSIVILDHRRTCIWRAGSVHIHNFYYFLSPKVIVFILPMDQSLMKICNVITEETA